MKTDYKKEAERITRNQKGFAKIGKIIISIFLLTAVFGLFEFLGDTRLFRTTTGVEWLLFGILVVLILILLAIIKREN